MLQQALRDLSRSVEEGIAPPPSTSYEVVDGQVIVPSDASLRRGIQPVVSLTVDGDRRADVAVGDAVTFRATAQVPERTGAIVTVEWDFDGAGSFPTAESIAVGEKVEVERRFSFAAPGVYFPTVRVAAHRSGDRTSPYARILAPGWVPLLLPHPPAMVATATSEKIATSARPRECFLNSLLFSSAITTPSTFACDLLCKLAASGKTAGDIFTANYLFLPPRDLPPPPPPPPRFPPPLLPPRFPPPAAGRGAGAGLVLPRLWLPRVLAWRPPELKALGLEPGLGVAVEG